MVKKVGTKPSKRRPGLLSSVKKKPDSRTRGRAAGRELVVIIIVAIAGIAVFAYIFLRPVPDRGIRLWLLNHAPDQLVVVNPDTGETEKELLIADGLKQFIFNHAKDTAYIANVVDVSNRITLVDTRSYLKKEQIIVDGVPQGLDIFPDDRYLAAIMGSKTDFMAGGFDVLDLHEPSQADPQRKRVTYRERGLTLTAVIAVDSTGENVICLDAKASNVFIFNVAEQKLARTIDLGAAPLGMLYPPEGGYFFVCSIKDQLVTVLTKNPDPQKIEIAAKIETGRVRDLALSTDGKTLFAPVYERKDIAVIDLDKMEVVKRYETPDGCMLAAASPLGDQLYAIGYDSGKVFVLDLASGELVRTIATHGEFRDMKVILESAKPRQE